MINICYSFAGNCNSSLDKCIRVLVVSTFFNIQVSFNYYKSGALSKQVFMYNVYRYCKHVKYIIDILKVMND